MPMSVPAPSSHAGQPQPVACAGAPAPEIFGSSRCVLPSSPRSSTPDTWRSAAQLALGLGQFGLQLRRCSGAARIRVLTMAWRACFCASWRVAGLAPPSAARRHAVLPYSDHRQRSRPAARPAPAPWRCCDEDLLLLQEDRVEEIDLLAQSTVSSWRRAAPSVQEEALLQRPARASSGARVEVEHVARSSDRPACTGCSTGIRRARSAPVGASTSFETLMKWNWRSKWSSERCSSSVILSKLALRRSGSASSSCSSVDVDAARQVQLAA